MRDRFYYPLYWLFKDYLGQKVRGWILIIIIVYDIAVGIYSDGFTSSSSSQK